MPKPTPAPQAIMSDSRSGRPMGPVRLTRAMAARAATMPTIAVGPGRSPATRPPTTGSTAEITAVMGEITVIRPPASPR